MILLQFGLNEGNIVMDQIFNFSVLPGTGNSLRASLADEQAVAGTSHISKKSNDKYCSLTKTLTEILLSARWSISYWCCLVAGVTLDHVLVFLARDVDHCLERLSLNP